MKNEIQILKNEKENLKNKLDELNLIKYKEIKKLEEKYKQLSDEKMKILDDLILKMNNSNSGPNINNNTSY